MKRESGASSQEGIQWLSCWKQNAKQWAKQLVITGFEWLLLPKQFLFKTFTFACLRVGNCEDQEPAYSSRTSTNNQRSWWGGSDLNPFLKRKNKNVPFVPPQRPADSVTCTLGEDHTAGRQGSAPLAVRWPSLCLLWWQIPAGDAADCWPHTHQCCLWSHSFKAAPALMQHLIGRDELFAAAAWGPVLLYTSHYLYLIRSLLPLCVFVCMCVCAHGKALYQQAPFTCLNASIFLHFDSSTENSAWIRFRCVHLSLNNWKCESIITL